MAMRTDRATMSSDAMMGWAAGYEVRDANIVMLCVEFLLDDRHLSGVCVLGDYIAV